MAWNFRKRMSILGGLFRINFSKRGISVTTGVKGASVNVSKNGAYLNLNVPSTGLYRRQSLSNSRTVKQLHSHNSPLSANFYACIPYEGNSWFTHEEYSRVVQPSFDLIKFQEELLPHPLFKKVMSESTFNITMSGKKLTTNCEILQNLVLNDAIYCYHQIMPNFTLSDKKCFGLLWLIVKTFDGVGSPICEEQWLDYSVTQLSSGADAFLKSLNHSPMDFPHIFIVSELLSNNGTDDLLLKYLKIMDSFYKVATSFHNIKSSAVQSFQSKIEELIIRYSK